MPRVKLVDIIDELSIETRSALSATVKEVIPGAVFDERVLFRVFRKELDKKCHRWEKVRSTCVDPD